MVSDVASAFRVNIRFCVLKGKVIGPKPVALTTSSDNILKLVEMLTERFVVMFETVSRGRYFGNKQEAK